MTDATQEVHSVEYIAWCRPRIVNGVVNKARHLGVSVEDPVMPYLEHKTDDSGLRRLYKLVTERPRNEQEKTRLEELERELFYGLATKV